MKNKYLTLKKDIKKLVDRSSKFTKSHHYFVVIVMHELFRNLYYFDPYIKTDEKDHYKRLKFTTKLEMYSKQWVDKKLFLII